MTPGARCVFGLAVVAAACGADSIGGPGIPANEIRSWTVILTDTTGSVWIAQTAPGGPKFVPRATNVIAAALWQRFDSEPVRRDLALEFSVSPRPTDVHWLLRAPESEVPLASGEGTLVINPKYGIWHVRGRALGTVSAAAMTFDLLSDTPFPADTFVDPMPGASIAVSTPAVVSLRIDDCARKDIGGVRLLEQYGLTASLGVPTSVIDRPWACGEALLHEVAANGGRIEAHSRSHGAAPATFAEFYLETVGAAQDLRARGFDPQVFIVPGTWRAGPASFDRPEEMQGPYWQLMRRVYMTVDGGLFPAACTLPRPGRDGPVSWPIKAFTPDSLARRIRHAIEDSTWINFMWHSVEMPPAELEARLKVIAALRDSGLVTVMPFYTALHATRPALSP